MVTGSVRRVWALKEMEQPVIDFDLSARLLYEIDCLARRERLCCSTSTFVAALAAVKPRVAG